MRSVVVIAEAGKKSGMGHVVRQFALCRLLGIQDKVTAYIQSDWTDKEVKGIDFLFDTYYLVKHTSVALEQVAEGTLILLDAYNLDIEKVNKLKEDKKLQIIFVADVHKEVPNCDVLINHLPWIKSDDYSSAVISKRLLGPKYAILRAPFYSQKKNADKKRILICLGGSDIEPQIAKIVKALQEHGFPSHKIDVLHNKPIQEVPIENLHYNLNAEQVYSLISDAHICFITPGNISYEVFSINRTVIMGYVSESQKEVVKQFHDMGLSYDVGEWNSADFKNLSVWIIKAEDTKNCQASFFKDLHLSNIKNELSLYIS
ncbi:MAG: hypothetical protein WAQ28_20055 [Bacteroidia bacterium]